MQGKKRLKVAVMYGGRSREHEISIITALQAIEALDTLKYELIPVYITPKGKWYTGPKLFDKKIYPFFENHLHELKRVTLLPEPGDPFTLLDKGELRSKLSVDLAFLCFHGEQGEDGCIQGLLELADIPYTGCGVTASSVAMNKFICKGFLASLGVPVLPSICLHKQEAIDNFDLACNRVFQTKGLEKFPLFIKPCNLGSSIGVSIATDRLSLERGLARAFSVDLQVMLEPCIEKIMEINVSVMKEKEPTVSVVEIPVAADRVLTFEDKYLRHGGKKTGNTSEGMASLTRVIDPKDLDPNIRDKVRSLALDSFKALNCEGVVRFDFIVDLKSGNLYFNELNVLPGSIAFYLWQSHEPRRLYTEMLDTMIEGSILRKRSQLSLERQIEFRALV